MKKDSKKRARQERALARLLKMTYVGSGSERPKEDWLLYRERQINILQRKLYGISR